MGIFDFIFKRNDTQEVKTETPQELENEYLSPSVNNFAFQEKFYNQSERLLKVFGYANAMIPNTVKLLIITDTHNTLNEEELIDAINMHPNYDICVLLGDHSDADIRKILNHIPKEKIYALLGNHDTNYIENYNFNNLNGRIIEINGVKLMGIQGSFKYKPVNFPSFSQEDSIRFLNDKEPVDILLSHDGPFNDESTNNPAHQGLFGITYYLYKNHVKYNVHGHIHERFNKQLINGTKEMSLFGIEYIELS